MKGKGWDLAAVLAYLAGSWAVIGGVTWATGAPWVALVLGGLWLLFTVTGVQLVGLLLWRGLYRMQHDAEADAKAARQRRL